MARKRLERADGSFFDYDAVRAAWEKYVRKCQELIPPVEWDWDGKKWVLKERCKPYKEWPEDPK